MVLKSSWKVRLIKYSFFVLFLFLIFILTYSIHVNQSELSQNLDDIVPLKLPNNIDEYFIDKSGCFIIYDFKTDLTYTYNENNANKRMSPCSTFKICASLFALDAGVIDTETVYEWDRTKYKINGWNDNQTLSSAVKYSVVWFFQKLAINIGKSNMQAYIDKIDYGNRNISGGISNFWLLSSLETSPNEQIELLKKLYNNQLPFSKDTQDKVKDILILEENENFSLSGKTGTGENKLGWFIGMIKNKQKQYAFVTNIEGISDANGQRAKEITISILEYMNIYANNN